MTVREAGFYWVKLGDTDQPRVAEWSEETEHWSFAGMEYSVHDDRVVVLAGPVRIEDPPKAPRITGYRGLSDGELQMVNETKALAEKCREHIDRLRAMSAKSHVIVDFRSLAMGTADLQSGFMWVVRSITKPTTF